MDDPSIQFGNPWAFHLLWGLPVLVAFAWWTERRRAAAALRMTGARLSERLRREVSGTRRGLKWTCTVAGMTLLVLALARPQWGRAIVRVSRKGLDIIVALDTSRSMLASDHGLISTRLDRAKRKVRDLIDSLEGDRIGIMAFAGEAFLACPLTTDYEAAKLFLEDIDTDSVPRGGTRVGDAIRRAVTAFENKSGPHRALVIVTDGGDQESRPVEAARAAYGKGLRIFTIGVGGTRPVTIKIRDEKGRLQYVKDEKGNFITSRLEEGVLKAIALAADGAYVPAKPDLSDIEAIYNNRIARMEETEMEQGRRNVPIERFRWPLSMSGGLIVLAGLLRERRRREDEV